MAKKQRDKWQLQKNEVTWHGGGSTSTHRKKRPAASRAVDDRSWHFTLVHVPSGMEVSGEVPKGNYSQKQMQQERENLFSELWGQLELKVARHLRLPGW
ncbi:MAG: hypothetical protein ACRBB6_00240 [Neptuniibacter sp.]